MTGILILLRAGAGIALFFLGADRFKYPDKWRRFVFFYFPEAEKFLSLKIVQGIACVSIALAVFLISGLYGLEVTWLAFIWEAFFVLILSSLDWARAIPEIPLFFSLGALILLQAF